jgi:diguanylate cyclase (GGDEF)-like protein
MPTAGTASEATPRKPLIDELTDILAEDLPDQETARQVARQVLSGQGDEVYTQLLWNITNLRYPVENAKALWQQVMDHHIRMSERLGRNVGIRIAALDYFTNVLGRIARPRIVDPQVLERLYRDATIDPLTELANRRCYRERLQNEISRSQRYKSSFVLALLDLDNFKAINDTRGHAEGDRILQRVASAIRGSIRECDLAARWGGEEFVLLMPETGKKGALTVAERIRKKVEQELSREQTTVSGGLVAFPGDGTDEKTLFTYADRALYRAKSEGKNRICLTPLERRAYPRLHERFSMRITPMPENHVWVQAQTENISGGGLAFTHHEPLGISNRFMGQIEAGDQLLAFTGKIVFLEEIQPGRYLVGTQFVEIDPETRGRIMALVS